MKLYLKDHTRQQGCKMFKVILFWNEKLGTYHRQQITVYPQRWQIL